MTSEELVKVKSSAGTDTYVYTTESKQAHGHQNQTWQIVRLLPKGSLSADSPSNYQVHTIQKRAISSVNLNTANSELLPGTSNQSSQANIVSTAKGHSYRRFQNICLLCIYYKGHVNLWYHEAKNKLLHCLLAYFFLFKRSMFFWMTDLLFAIVLLGSVFIFFTVCFKRWALNFYIFSNKAKNTQSLLDRPYLVP